MLRLIVLSVLLCAARADGKPLHSYLDAILKDSPTIVIAKLGPIAGKPYEATSYTLAVERSIRGTVKPGKLVVKPSEHGHAYMPVGTRVIAFVNAKQEWIAFGVAFAGPSLEDGVIRLAGFYDFNAHVVTPGTVTLAELERLITKGTAMKWVFKGPVMVASSSGLVASKLQLAVDLQAGTVTGWPNKLAGFPEKPVMRVGSWEGADVSVTYRASSDRPLELEGEATGKNADGSIAVKFKLREPSILTETDLLRYVGDAKLGHPYHELTLDLGAQRLPVELDRSSGRIGTIGTEQVMHTTMSPTREMSTANAKIEFAATGYKAALRDTTAMLVEEAMIAPLACKYTPTHGNTIPCTLKYVGTKFEKP